MKGVVSNKLVAFGFFSIENTTKDVPLLSNGLLNIHSKEWLIIPEGH